MIDIIQKILVNIDKSDHWQWHVLTLVQLEIRPRT